MSRIAIMRLRTAEKVNDKYLIDAEEYHRIKQCQAQIYLADAEIEDLRNQLEEFERSYLLLIERAVKRFFKKLKQMFTPKKKQWQMLIQEDEE